MSIIKQSDQLFSFEFRQKLAPGISFPARSSIIVLENREAIIISPGPFDSQSISEIQKLADKFYIVAPNLFHHLHFLKAKESFKNSELYAPKSLSKKNAKYADQYHIIDELPKHVKEQVKIIPINGHKALQEWVFYHSKSQSLVLTDLAFNMGTQGFLTASVLKLAGAYKKLAQSRLVKSTITDKQQFHQSIWQLSLIHISEPTRRS